MTWLPDRARNDGRTGEGGGETRRARRDGGFTLLEILVVTFIIGIAALLATVSVSTDQGAQVRDNAAQLYDSISLAQEESVLQNEWIGLHLSTKEEADDWRFQGYQWLISNDEAQTWQPLNSPYLQRHTLPAGMTIDLTVGGERDLRGTQKANDRLSGGGRRAEESPSPEGKTEAGGKPRSHPPPHILFYPDGGSDAFEMVLEAEGAPQRSEKIFSDELGRLERESDYGAF